MASPAMSEATLLSAVRSIAQMRGYLVYHTHRSERSEPGFPDLVLLRAPRVVFAELKSATGQLRPAQVIWLAALHACPGVEAYLWRPADLQEIARILR